VTNNKSSLSGDSFSLSDFKYLRNPCTNVRR